jgi:uncharacterized membrane protein
MASAGYAARRRANEPFGGARALALLAIAVTLLGFWRTFFTQLGNTDTLHMLHGVSSVGWLVLVLVQASLIRARQFNYHRLLGWCSLVLFTLLLVSAWNVLALMLSGKSGVPFDFAKLFALSDITALPLFMILYGAAIALRKDRHVHSRLISATLLAGLLPATARMFNLIWPGPEGLIFAMHPTYLFELAILAVLIYFDWRAGRLRWPFPFAFVWLALAYATLFPVWHTVWFDHLCKAIAATA